MLVLGISDLEHDTAAALMNGWNPVAAVEEDKLSRTQSSAGLPGLGIDYCLREARVQAADLTAAAVATRPKRAWLRAEASRLRLRGLQPEATPGRTGSDGVLWKLNHLQLLRKQLGTQAPLLQFEHHLCHAASAFYPTGFDRALVMTLDESGDMWSGLIVTGEGTDLRALRPMRLPHSLGWFYAQITGLLGYRPAATSTRCSGSVRKVRPSSSTFFAGSSRPLMMAFPRLAGVYLQTATGTTQDSAPSSNGTCAFRTRSRLAKARCVLRSPGALNFS